jgi:hypothetical protein
MLPGPMRKTAPDGMVSELVICTRALLLSEFLKDTLQRPVDV